MFVLELAWFVCFWEQAGDVGLNPVPYTFRPAVKRCSLGNRSPLLESVVAWPVPVLEEIHGNPGEREA